MFNLDEIINIYPPSINWEKWERELERDVIFSVKNEENIESIVTYNTNTRKYYVTLQDLDSGEYFSSHFITPKREQAIKKAKEWTNTK